MVDKLRLPTHEHSRPYKLCGIQEFSDIGEEMVNKQVRVSFQIGKYEDEVLCDVVLIETTHLILGRPWRFKRQARYDVDTNKYSFVFNNWKITLVPLKPKQVHQDQMYLQRGSEKIKMSEKNIEVKESDEKKDEESNERR